MWLAKVKLGDKSTETFGDGGWLMYNGRQVRIALNSRSTPLEISDTSIGEIKGKNNSIGIKLIGGLIRIAVTPHYESKLDMNTNLQITLFGGNILRNASDEFVIRDFTMLANGLPASEARGEVLDNTMNIIGRMIKDGYEAVANPLPDDEKNALDNDIRNYNKLFLGIPLHRCQ
ncbi:unnamed protein product [Anisakis simplex]|uniref:BPI2 domain-containing protein n=1 Tax=Anisakis simplex TaxID=6269 RepID=A0A0M3KJ28_ANISI|nr:unnamed protein product [Anisakis simplex]